MTTSVEYLIAGIHSRSENLVRVSRDYDRGRTTEDALNSAFEKDASDLLELQKRSGFSLFSDGQLRWQDFIRPFSESVSGMESGADLSRWFDTNTFYRKPTVAKKISTDGSFIQQRKYSEDVNALSEEKQRLNQTIAIPGPFTLASLVDDQFYGSREDLVHEFARVLKQVIIHVSKNGYSVVQINEPSLVYRYGESAIANPRNLDTFISAFSENLSNLETNIILHTYFGDCSSLLENLIKLPGVSTIGVDFTQTSLESISSLNFEGKRLGCGCVDARSSLLETPEWISDFSIKATNAVNPSGLVILPSSDLKYLPRAYADQKVSSIGRAAHMVTQRLSN